MSQVIDENKYYRITDEYYFCCDEVMFRYYCKSCSKFMGCYFCQFDYDEPCDCQYKEEGE